MSSQSLRLFAGLYPPSALRQEIERELQSGALPRARWVVAEQMHLTLAFLGDQPRSALPGIRSALERACESAAPLRIRFSAIDGFPSPRRARVLVLKVGRGADALAQLHADFVDALDADARPSDGRNFRPHLTLARFREPPSTTEWEALRARLRSEAWEFELSQACLVQSRLGPSGARHELLHRVGFGS